MPVDLSQFHQTFFEESFEGLGVMESGLLALIPGNADPESINTLDEPWKAERRGEEPAIAVL